MSSSIAVPKVLYRVATPETVELRYRNGYRIEFEPSPGPGNELFLYLTPEQVQDAALHGVRCDAVQPRR